MSKFLYMTLTLLFFSSQALASGLIPEVRAVQDKDLYKPHVGIKVGVSEPEGNTNASTQISANIGYQPIIPFSIGLEGGYVKFDNSSQNLERTSLLAYANYNFGGKVPIIKHSYVGVSTGIAWENEDNSDGLAFIVSPAVGFDHPLGKFIGKPITLGANLSYNISSRSALDTLNISGVIKYWY